MVACLLLRWPFQVYPIGECEEHIVINDQLMTYTVRFQNTGNAEAIDVYILDSLDSGVYFMRVKTLLGESTVKLVKQ